MHDLCGAHCRTTGKPCLNPPLTDATRCRMHGGKTPQAQGRAVVVGIEREARRALADLGAAEPVVNPLLELQQLAGEIIAFKNALRGMVEHLNSVRYDGAVGEQVKGEIIVYERALDRCVRVLRDISSLGIDARIVEIQSRTTEAQGHAVAEVIRAILDDLRLTPEQQARVSEVVPRRLREYGDAGPDAVRKFTEVPRRLTLADFDRELDLLRAERDALPPVPGVGGWTDEGEAGDD